METCATHSNGAHSQQFGARSGQGVALAMNNLRFVYTRTPRGARSATASIKKGLANAPPRSTRHSNFGRRHGRSCTSRRFRVYETQILDRKCNPWTTLDLELLRMCSVAVRGARFHTARACVSGAPNYATVATSGHLGRVLEVQNCLSPLPPLVLGCRLG